jgi:hypothetical protein
MGSGSRGPAGRASERHGVPDPVILDFQYRPPERRTDSTAEGAERGDAATAELARRVNASIYKLGQSLTEERDEEFELTFFCACGCMTEVRRSLQSYVAGGAVVDGHLRPAGQGLPLDPYDP